MTRADRRWLIQRTGDMVAIVDDEGEELAAGRCPVWGVAAQLVRPAATMDRKEAIRLSVLLWALVWSWSDVAGTVARWRELTPSDAYWLGRKAEKHPAWRLAIGVAIGESHRA